MNKITSLIETGIAWVAGVWSWFVLLLLPVASCPVSWMLGLMAFIGLR